MTDLTKATTVDQLVEIFDQATSEIKTAFRILVDAEKKLSTAFALADSHKMYLDHHDLRYKHDPDRVVEKLTVQAWQCLIERLELQRMVSTTRWEEINSDIKAGKFPEITKKSVRELLQSVSSALPEMFSEAVTEVHEFLRPPRSKLKTNSQFDVPRKVILEGILDDYSYAVSGKMTLSFYRQQIIRSLDSVFFGLDGKGTTLKTYQGELWAALDGAPTQGETTYFKFKKFRNKNLHLEFKRLDLLKQLNAIAGGKRLKPVNE